jgi:hypothetical protein
MNELPPGVDLDMLRCLDELGLVEVLFRYWQSCDPRPGNPATRVEAHLGWFSPLASPTMGGNWSQVFEYHQRDKSNLPMRVRLNDKGLAARARLTRGKITTLPDRTAARKPSGRSSQGHAPLRPYTLKALEEEIVSYRTRHSAEYEQLRERIHAGDLAAILSARALFGRNRLVRSLGVKSGAMVSKTKAWKSIRADLHLGATRRRSRFASAAPQLASANPTLDAVCDAELKAMLDELGSRGEVLRRSLESGDQTAEQVLETARILSGRA